MSILNSIVSATEQEIKKRQEAVSIDELMELASGLPEPRSLVSALSSGFSIIGEVKAESPSAGKMAPENVHSSAKVYANTEGIAAISVLTEPHFFGGYIERLDEIKPLTSKPLLRKDFILSEYQIWEARAHGADAVLLMASIHARNPGRLRKLYEFTRSIGMDALVEIGMADRSMSLKQMAQEVPAEVRVWGVNSRKFHGTPFQVKRKISRILGRDWTTSTDRHAVLRELIPHGRIAVAESGVSDSSYLRRLANLGYDAALIGTSFLKSGVVVDDVVSEYSGVALGIRGERRAATH